MNKPSLVVEMHNISRNYGNRCAVDNCSLTVTRGECLALIGHNGAGKTTLLKIILGLTRYNSGSISVLGHSPSHISNRHNIAYMPETVSFTPAMTGEEMLRFYARLKNAEKDEYTGLLDLVGLSRAAGFRIATYSKGMRQRLGLAQALIGKPDLILLDEPTSGLDPSLRRHFYEVIDTFRSAGTTVIISSHALSEIETRVDRIVILDSGKIVVEGSIERLRELANLPIRIQAHFHKSPPPELLNNPNTLYSQRCNNHCIEFACTKEQKISLLCEISSHHYEVDNIEIIPPSLDDLYLHFAGQEDST